MKFIPNAHISQTLGLAELNGLDGELVVGPANAANCMNATIRGVMSQDGTPDFQYMVFDCWDSPFPYFERLLLVEAHNTHPNVVVLPHVRIESYDAMLEYEEKVLGDGYEGIILRGFNNTYKNGRSTLREGGMIKVKRFDDSEAEIVGFDQLMRNLNPAFKNEVGLTMRSTEQDNRHPDDMLGSLHVRDIHSNVMFEVGSGFTEAERISLWNDRANLKGQLIKYKHFSVGVKNKPRFPIFLGFRSKLDI